MMSQTGRRELLAAVRPRYTFGNRTAKERILDEFVAATGYHRKYAIQLLNHPPPKRRGPQRRKRAVKYDGAVRAALERLWHLANGICGKRLVAALPTLLEALERHGELTLAPDTRALVLSVSPATADRLLARVRQRVPRHGLTATKPGSLLKAAIPIRTFADWDDARPGFLEVDLVAHCGATTAGEYLNSLNMVDVKTRWVEFAALANRSQATVTAAIQACQIRLPYPLLGLDSDNGGEFINDNLKRYCEQEQITFTRSRPYKKNDQAYVEQKNWTAIRQFVGYERYEGSAACSALQALYQPLRLYLNFFQPVMVLIAKQRDGAHVKKCYDAPQTPYQRVLAAPEVSDERKARLRQLFLTLNPAELLRQIHRRQETFWRLAHTTRAKADDSGAAGNPGSPHPS
jgi:hypothetical protein